MKDLFQHVGAVETKGTYGEALTKIFTGLQNRTNSCAEELTTCQFSTRHKVL